MFPNWQQYLSNEANRSVGPATAREAAEEVARNAGAAIIAYAQQEQARSPQQAQQERPTRKKRNKEVLRYMQRKRATSTDRRDPARACDGYSHVTSAAWKPRPYLIARRSLWCGIILGTLLSQEACQVPFRRSIGDPQVTGNLGRGERGILLEQRPH
jgi:hypothetical protein